MIIKTEYLNLKIIDGININRFSWIAVFYRLKILS